MKLDECKKYKIGDMVGRRVMPGKASRPIGKGKPGLNRKTSVRMACGYGEILNPSMRYSIIDQKALMSKCGYNSEEQFRKD